MGGENGGLLVGDLDVAEIDFDGIYKMFVL